MNATEKRQAFNAARATCESPFYEQGHRDGAGGSDPEPPMLAEFAAEYRQGYIAGRADFLKSRDLFT